VWFEWLEMSDIHLLWRFHTPNPHMHLHNCDHRALIEGSMFVSSAAGFIIHGHSINAAK